MAAKVGWPMTSCHLASGSWLVIRVAAKSETPQILLPHHLRKLKLPTFLREHEKIARLSVASSYSRGDREFEQAPAMLFPSEIAQRGPMHDHTAAHFRRVSVWRRVCSRMIEIELETP